MEDPFEALQSYIQRAQDRRAEVQSIIDKQQAAARMARPSTVPGNAGAGNKVPGGSGGGGSIGPVAKHGKMGFKKFTKRIGIKESGGSYSSMGEPTSTGDVAYGKYQVMRSNIPSWTQQYLGHTLTPQQYLSRPKAQDRVALGKLKYYYSHYGPGGAAAAWYAGEGAATGWRHMRTPSYSPAGTRYPSVYEYVKDILGK